jgi:tripartite ATP-independent transporter DctM subunit
MSKAAAAATPSPLTPLQRVGAFLRGTENWVLTLALAVMMLLPLIEMGLRKAGHTGLAGTNSIVQHLTLILGMLGGAVAAREARLLAMSSANTFFKGRMKEFAGIFSGAFAAVITVFLCVAGWQFAQSTHEAGDKLAYEVPAWIVQLVMPVGFALIVWRLLWHASAKWKGRALALVATIALVWFALKTPIAPEKLVTPGLIVLLLATILGAPVFVTLGGAAVILFWGMEMPIASVPLDHYRLVTNPSLPAIPLFTLAGYFLAEGGASKRLIRVFQALFRPVPGGTAIVTCVACAFFTTFTGASGVTILALGGLLMPVLLAEKYSERNALGLITSAGALGSLFPPCLPLFLYAIIAGNAGADMPLESIFLGGLIPGLLLVAGTAGLGAWQGRSGLKERPPFNGKEAWAALWDAKWELAIPIIALGGIFGGIATAVETAALTACYAFCVETFVYKDLKLTKDVPRVMTEGGLVVGGVLLILGVALAFTNYLVTSEIATAALDWVQANIKSALLFLLVLNLFLLVVGCLMDVYSAIIVVVPLLVPMGEAFGIHPVHLAIVFLANLELGFLTPPVGMNLFLASYRFNKPLPEVYRSVVPMLIVRFLVVLLITYVPFFTTWLPDLFQKMNAAPVP